MDETGRREPTPDSRAELRQRYGFSILEVWERRLTDLVELLDAARKYARHRLHCEHVRSLVNRDQRRLDQSDVDRLLTAGLASIRIEGMCDMLAFLRGESIDLIKWLDRCTPPPQEATQQMQLPLSAVEDRIASTMHTFRTCGP